ncbi:ion channel [Bradyrhizobium quebecense]|uniref:Potassium channel domain-containing protein n=1 Tax=Bradyrhizobium quebecense TaxID=2748629 RepID=A0A973WNN3_9BRAD|nr:ion channel [Bradyrhizobium quebecense]UGA48180.1 ion channel [Bradyrhizobium quebecense]
MFLTVLFAACLVVITVAIHAIGLDTLLRCMMRSHALAASGFRRVTSAVIALACWLVLIHLAEISVWGLFYFWQGCLPDLGSAFYFSAGAYTTIGSGLALPAHWRMFAPLEALSAALMFGLSTGLFFAVVSRWIRNWTDWQNALTSDLQQNK